MKVLNVLEVVRRAQACCARVPDRNVGERTQRSYEKEFSRMWEEGNLDPLKDRMARDTYNHRRAALHTGGKLYLQEGIARCMEAGEARDAVAAVRRARELHRAVETIEKAFDLEPPLPAGASPFDSPPSRFRGAETANRKRGLHSKKYDLGVLPQGWDSRLWDEATSVENKDWSYRDELAVLLLAGVRAEDLVPGLRPTGPSPGVLVELRSQQCLAITFMASKSRNGLFGTGATTICIDPTLAGDAAEFLAARCGASHRHRIVVNTRSKEALRKAIVRLGESALDSCDVAITPNTFRHQVLADLKATFGSGQTVAAAAGHSTDRTQARYGSVHHGRPRVGYISITPLRRPRTGNVEKARKLGQRKAPRTKAE